MSEQGRPPLEGLRVLDLSRIIAGPFCTMQLADLGAEIIKIELPGSGDDSRKFKPPAQGGESHFYLAYNRNKKSVALDLKGEAGREVLHALAAQCQVLVENFRPGVMARLGLDYAAMKARHPQLIYCSISSYGQQGIMADRPGLDPVLQAEMGMMALTGEPEGVPTRHPMSLNDLFSGLYASTAILAAVTVQRQTGQGQQLELSLMGSALAVMSNYAQYCFASGEDPPRMGNTHLAAAPVGLFHARDGAFYLACGTDRLFNKVCTEVLQRPEICEDPRFIDNAGRVKHREELFALLNDAFGSDSLESWLKKMRSAGVAAGPVRTVSQALASPEVQESGMITSVPHPTAGDLRMIGTPYRFSDTPPAEPVAPPLLGEHTEEVLRGLLGMDSAELARLREAGAIP